MSPAYTAQIAPLLKKYCVACHNQDDREGKLSLESFAELQRGGEHGPILFAGQSETSRMVRLMTGQAEPRMPPEGSPAPSAAEIKLLQAWIDAGAKGPDGAEPDRNLLLVPQIAPAKSRPAVTAVAYSPDGRWFAQGTFGRVEIKDVARGEVVARLAPVAGKVHAVQFSADGRQLLTASGISGLSGQAILWSTENWQKVREFSGHRDAMLDAVLSPDGRYLASCSYDRRILMWDAATGQLLRTIEGHNDAIYDLDFSPDGRLLASASGDKTVKIWKVETGERLDTLSQPQGEQFTVVFSPDGKQVLAGGADNRLRVWKLVSVDKPRINPLLYARFAHEGPVLRIAFVAGDGKLVSASQDRSLKLWETQTYSEIQLYPPQSDDVLTVAAIPGASRFTVGRADGSVEELALAAAANAPSAPRRAADSPMANAPSKSVDPLREVVEVEPNNAPTTANAIPIPAQIRGVIQAVEAGVGHDFDYYRFTARQGQKLVFEVKAARDNSPLDSRIEVLTLKGQPIERVVLQAVRDSYFTFRGKDSDTSDDFRVQNWEEMELNDYLYADGEVVKLWLYPRGPDSGFKVYPGAGKRWTYFDTTPVAHAVFGPCYIVQPVPPGASPIPNGLPVFPIYYENDDDSKRQWGSDSRLHFQAPADAEYLVRIGDARGFEGELYKYQLTVRPAQPDFKVTVGGANPEVSAGSGKEFSVTVERFDEFEGDVTVSIEGLPPGFRVTSPLVIQAGQTTALGCITADADAPPPTPENAKQTKLVASALVHGQTVTHEVGTLGEIKLGPKPKILLTLHPSSEHPGAVVSDPNLPPTPEHPLELQIAPGQTISAVVRVNRNGHQGNVPLGKEDSGRNLPHGVYVDNIGLNGLLIVENQDERTFFITAAKWVPETTRRFHLRAEIEGNQTSWPVVLHVRPAK